MEQKNRKQSGGPGSLQASAQIAIAMTGSDKGLIIATPPRLDPYVSPERLLVGDVHRHQPDGGTETWKAWLWPVPGGALHVTRSVEAIEAGAADALQGKLQKRADQGAWWTDEKSTGKSG